MKRTYAYRLYYGENMEKEKYIYVSAYTLGAAYNKARERAEKLMEELGTSVSYEICQGLN